ncbi:hypothetical protein SAMN06269173_109127 [Hymenobacter mucosus]|uniref:Uncharacterized protein n=1 Tax=Hymenobacter mucosus TaxID=1411120 RepID=A0A238ZTP0_9BACT|nr:hypothetical protein SAMN06269173_109127 [Hymenobacter mucosus]
MQSPQQPELPTWVFLLLRFGSAALVVGLAWYLVKCQG